MEVDIQTKLNQLLGKDHLREVLEILQNESIDLGKELEEEILLISAKFTRIERQELLGTVERQQINIELNRIREALVKIVQTIPPNADTLLALQKRQKRRKQFFWVTFVIYLLIVAILLFFAFQPKKDIRIEAQLLVEQVSFRHKEGAYAFNGRALSALHIYNYAKLETTGRNLIIDGDANDQGKNNDPHSARELTIEPYPDVAGVGVNLGSVVVEEFSIPTLALLTLIHPKNKLEPFQLNISNESPLVGHLSYADKLDITAENADLTVEGQQYDLFGPTLLHLFAEQGKAHEIKMESYPGTLTLDMYLLDSLLLNAKGLLVSEISFYKSVEQLAVSSIIEGEVHLNEVGKNPLEAIPLGEGETLNLIGASSLSLDRLTIDMQGIHLSFTGKVQTIESGRNEEIRNPLKIRWFWHNQPWWVMGFLIPFVGIPLLLHALWRKRVTSLKDTKVSILS